MHGPAGQSFIHLGPVAVPTQGLLAAIGLVGGLLLACSLAARCRVDPDRIWNLGLTGLLTLFLGERLLVILFNLRDFLAHPFWMLGLTVVRDERYFYGGALLALITCAGYVVAWRLDRRAVLDALAPGAGFALACLSLGALASGANFGRPTTAAWGIVYTSQAAARLNGTPLGVPLVPVALYAAVMHFGLAAGAAWLVMRAGRPGVASAFWLFSAGLGTVLLGQLRYRLPGELLVANAYTPAQAVGILAVLFSGVLWLEFLQELQGSNATIV